MPYNRKSEMDRKISTLKFTHDLMEGVSLALGYLRDRGSWSFLTTAESNESPCLADLRCCKQSWMPYDRHGLSDGNDDLDF